MKRALGTALLASALTLGLVTSGMAAPRKHTDSTTSDSASTTKDSKQHKKSHKKHQKQQPPASAPQ